MATTTPDNLRSPNPTDPYNPIADWAISMSDVQAALNRRANLYVGTSAQRVAFTTAGEGVHWQDTNGSKTRWIRKGSAWVADRISGTTTITTTSSPGGTVKVTFPAGSFANPPMVMATKQSGGGAKYVPYVVDVTATGFTAGVYAGDGTNGSQTISFGWIAFSV